ncbi:NB-ARC domain-containing protein [Saccharopolyspora sp. SCSIO 74807]|uniref:NB-ARC domain-containing protein n=1 Tax=Saccharopolyspora sp. SCSIO 74807 TaxID=3118084 RepID=UPI0030CB860B
MIIQGNGVGPITFAAPAMPYVGPPQPLAPPDYFVDREDQFRDIRELADTTGPSCPRPPVGVVAGIRGVGKTALLRKAGADLSGSFSDGILHVAYGPHEKTPHDAMARMLAQMHFPQDRVPSDTAMRADCLRAMLARKRVVILLDNVTNPEQVTSVLPTSGTALVLVATDRPALLEDLYVDGALPLDLRQLDSDDAVDLLFQICSECPIKKDSAEVKELAALCGCLPLALRIVGAQLVMRPWLTVSDLVEELRTSGSRTERKVLAQLSAAFDLVYRNLTKTQKEVYRALGLFRGSHFSAEPLAAMLKRDVKSVRDDLRELHLTCVVNWQQDELYSIHRLVRLHACRVSQVEDSKRRRSRMLRRAVNWWHFGTRVCDVTLSGTERLRITEPTDIPTIDREYAWSWFNREQSNIAAMIEAAAVKGWHRRVWQLFEAFFPFLDLRRPLSVWLQTALLAVDAAKHDDHRAAEARCRCLLAKVYQEYEKYSDAREELENAAALAANCGERLIASIHDFTGNLALREKRPGDALEHFLASLEINIRLGRRRGTAMQTWFVGRALRDLGRHDEAEERFAAAHQGILDAGSPDLAPRVLIDIAVLRADRGYVNETRALLDQAQEQATKFGNLTVEADVVMLRAELAGRCGDAAAESAYRNEAARLFERMGSPRAAHILANLRTDTHEATP